MSVLSVVSDQPVFGLFARLPKLPAEVRESAELATLTGIMQAGVPAAQPASRVVMEGIPGMSPRSLFRQIGARAVAGRFVLRRIRGRVQAGHGF